MYKRQVLFVIYLLASVVGPALTIALFEGHGEAGRTWEQVPLRNVIFAGLGFEVCALLCLLMLRDKRQLHEDEEARASAAAPTSGPGLDASFEAAESAPTPAEASDPKPSAESSTISALSQPMSRHAWAVPYVLFTSSVCFALGSGMTVKFFPLFFVNDCLMTPAQVRCLVIMPIRDCLLYTSPSPRD